MTARASAPDLSRPRERWLLTVFRPQDRWRLDTFVHARLAWRSRTSVQGLIRDGFVWRLGRPGRPGERVRLGETITLLVPPPPEPHPDPAAIPLTILHEDAWLVALDKQPGVLVHPVGRHRMDTLVNALHARYRRPDDPVADRVPKVVHRLDRDTSGVLLFALDDAVRSALGRAMEQRRMEKQYLALVWGEVHPDAFTIDLPIGVDPDGPVRIRRKAGVPDGLPARTDVVVRERLGVASLCAVWLRTGRTHQIRVHLAAIGHPICGDPLYGPGIDLARWRTSTEAPPLRDASGTVLLRRQALHAQRLTLTHPATGAPLTVEAPVPADLAAAIAGFRAGRIAPPGRG